MDFVEKLPAWARWILLPFGCVLAMFLVHVAARLFFWFQARMLGLGDGAWLELITDTVVVGGLTGYGTVYVASVIAPSNWKTVSLVVGGLVVMLSGFSLFVSLSRHQWKDAAEVLATVIGAGIAIYSVFENADARARLA